MADEPIKLEMIVGLNGAFIRNEDLQGPSATEPILTLNLVDQSGRIVLLPLSDTALARILVVLKEFEKGIDGLIGSKPFEPPRMQ